MGKSLKYRMGDPREMSEKQIHATNVFTMHFTEIIDSLIEIFYAARVGLIEEGQESVYGTPVSKEATTIMRAQLRFVGDTLKAADRFYDYDDLLTYLEDRARHKGYEPGHLVAAVLTSF